MIDWEAVKNHYVTFKRLAADYPKLGTDLLTRFPLVEPEPGEPLTGKLSDYVGYNKWLSTQIRCVSGNFGVKYKNGLIVRSPDLVVFAGNRYHYGRMLTLHAAVLMLCIYQTNLLFPRSTNQQIVFGDCGGIGGSHTYHNHFTVLDINYPTFLYSNTHYRVNDYPLEIIWQEDHYPYLNLIPGVIDFEKLQYFFLMIKRCFPYSSMAVNPGIHKELLKLYGYTPAHCSGDMEVYNHHRHVHIELGRDPDYNAEIGD